MKTISFIVSSWILSLSLLLAGCSSTPSKAVVGDPISQDQAAQGGTSSPASKDSQGTGTDSALTLDDFVGTWKAVSFADHGSGDLVDLKNNETALVVTPDGKLILTINNGTIHPIVYHADLSLEGGSKVKAHMFGEDAFDVAFSKDSMTWTSAPYSIVVPFKVDSGLLDATWERVSTYVPPSQELNVYDIQGDWKATSYILHKKVGPSEDLLKTYPDMSLTVQININEYLKIVIVDGKGNQTPYQDHFSVKPGNMMVIDKLKTLFPIGLSGDTLTFTAMTDFYGNTVDIVLQKTN